MCAFAIRRHLKFLITRQTFFTSIPRHPNNSIYSYDEGLTGNIERFAIFCIVLLPLHYGPFQMTNTLSLSPPRFRKPPLNLHNMNRDEPPPAPLWSSCFLVR